MTRRNSSCTNRVVRPQANFVRRGLRDCCFRWRLVCGRSCPVPLRRAARDRRPIAPLRLARRRFFLSNLRRPTARRTCSPAGSIMPGLTERRRVTTRSSRYLANGGRRIRPRVRGCDLEIQEALARLSWWHVHRIREPRGSRPDRFRIAECRGSRNARLALLRRQGPGRSIVLQSASGQAVGARAGPGQYRARRLRTGARSAGRPGKE